MVGEVDGGGSARLSIIDGQRSGSQLSPGADLFHRGGTSGLTPSSPTTTTSLLNTHMQLRRIKRVGKETKMDEERELKREQRKRKEKSRKETKKERVNVREKGETDKGEDTAAGVQEVKSRWPNVYREIPTKWRRGGSRERGE